MTLGQYICSKRTPNESCDPHMIVMCAREYVCVCVGDLLGYLQQLFMLLFLLSIHPTTSPYTLQHLHNTHTHTLTYHTHTHTFYITHTYSLLHTLTSYKTVHRYSKRQKKVPTMLAYYGHGEVTTLRCCNSLPTVSV